MREITAFILAGGKSRRMGTDKGLLPFNEKPVIASVYEALAPIAGKNIVVISSNKDYDFLGCTRIEDIVPDKGPVGGIYTALHHSETKLNLIISVDVPLVSTQLLQWIIENHTDEYLMTQIQSEEKTNPLIAVYDKSLEKIFEENTRNEQLKLRTIIDSIACQTLEIPKEWHFLVQNINTKEDYQNIL
jgi:molybdopterin-guanine dinucleotide biosynthesis protein A